MDWDFSEAKLLFDLCHFFTFLLLVGFVKSGLSAVDKHCSAVFREHESGSNEKSEGMETLAV